MDIGEMKGVSKEEVLSRLLEPLVERERLPDKEPFLSALVERESLGTTAVGGGIAVPHARVKGLESPVLALFRSREGIPFGAVDNAPVHLIFLVLTPEEATEMHLRTLARVVSLLRDQDIRGRLLQASGSKEMYRVLLEEDEGEE